MTFVSGVGFSRGCALLALKKPPPSPEISLIGSQDATRPPGIVWRTPVTPVSTCQSLRFWITPRPPSTTPDTSASGSGSRMTARVRPAQKLPHRAGLAAGKAADQGDDGRQTDGGTEERLGAQGQVVAERYVQHEHDGDHESRLEPASHDFASERLTSDLTGSIPPPPAVARGGTNSTRTLQAGFLTTSPRRTPRSRAQPDGTALTSSATSCGSSSLRSSRPRMTTMASSARRLAAFW
jgi:hypothetical protein